MNLPRLHILAAFAVMLSSLNAAEPALPKIPVVKTWGDLQEAHPIVNENPASWKRRATGEARPDAPGHLKIRIGVDRSESPYNDAALIYCLVEAADPVGPFHDGPDSLGPLTVRMEGPLQEAHAQAAAAAQVGIASPIRFYVQSVPLLKPGIHRIVVSTPAGDHHPALDIAAATVEVSQDSASPWLPWEASRRVIYDMRILWSANDVINSFVTFPTGGSPALPIVPGGTELPLKTLPAKSDFLPKLIPPKPALEILPLVDSIAVKLPAKANITPPSKFFLLRWWLNGSEQTGTFAPATADRFRAAAGTPVDLARFVIESPPPNAREGDTVSLQMLFCPRGIRSLEPEQQPLQVDNTWPAISDISPVADFVLRNGRLIPKAPASGGAAFVSLTSNSVPEGAAVTLRTSRKEYFLGENVLVDFVLKNKDAAPFTIEAGGDYRGSRRSLRFRVTATDAAGKFAGDPDPFPMCMGGMVSSPQIQSGENWVESLPLMRYRRFDQPGTYTIRASHDFGWTETSRPRPVGETTITLAMPDAAQAGKIVEEMQRTPEDPNRSFGKASSPFADFTCMRYPVYLAPLSRLAWSGDRRALQGLGAMETSGATGELIKLLDHRDAAFALEAALTLNTRLPDPEWAGRLASRSPFLDGRTEQRKHLVKTSWDRRFTPTVRAHASRLLATSDPRAVAAGGFMIQAVGEPADLQPVVFELDRQLSSFHDRKDPKDNILNAPAPIMELRRAAKVLTLRGDPPSKPTTPATQLVWLDTLPPKVADRPAGWADLLLPLLRSPSPLIREKAVSLLPSPLPPAARPDLAAAFSDPDLGVQRAACEWICASKDAVFRSEIVETLRTARHEWLFRSAANAAEILGARQAVFQANIARIEDKSQIADALRNLALLTITDFKGGSSGDTNRTPEELRDIKTAWQSLLDQHASEIDSGKKFRIGSPELSPALFGKALRLHFDDGSQWPK